MTKSICKHCDKEIELRFMNGRDTWVASGLEPQYCWIDPVDGSQLHEPVPPIPLATESRTDPFDAQWDLTEEAR